MDRNVARHFHTPPRDRPQSFMTTTLKPVIVVTPGVRKWSRVREPRRYVLTPVLSANARAGTDRNVTRLFHTPPSDRPSSFMTTTLKPVIVVTPGVRRWSRVREPRRYVLTPVLSANVRAGTNRYVARWLRTPLRDQLPRLWPPIPKRDVVVTPHLHSRLSGFRDPGAT